LHSGNVEKGDVDEAGHNVWLDATYVQVLGIAVASRAVVIAIGVKASGERDQDWPGLRSCRGVVAATNTLSGHSVG